MSRAPLQQSLADLGTPLHAVTFVVVDLETTGGSPAADRITEIGAVKVRGGEVLGEMATLVDPGTPIPPAIAALTGITDGLVAGFPPIEALLPAFLEFAGGATIVAHNARFDVGFLDANLTRRDYPRLQGPTVCTASLARRLVRDEVRNCKLATLAEHFRCRTKPVHRALADARATVEVFHGLLERAGSFGVVTLEDLVDFAKVRNAPVYKARKSLADDLPHEPGVYAFRSASGEVLYVGKATDLRSRVRSYFGTDTRRMVLDLMKETAALDHWVTPTPLEAAVRELRLIHAHRPRFNRRSKHPGKEVHVALTRERYPRLSTVRAAREGVPALGPLPSRRVAEAVTEAICDAIPVRRCTDRIGPRTRFAACALAEMGRCPAPCDGRIDEAAYAPVAEAVAQVLDGDADAVLMRLESRMRELAGAGRFEEAARARDRLRALVGALIRGRELAAVKAAGDLVASGPGKGQRREVIAVRAGRLVGSAACPSSEVERVAADLAVRLEQADDAPCPTEEALLVARWLDRPGVRLHAGGGWAIPVAGGRTLATCAERLRRAGRATGRPASELSAKRLRRPATAIAGGADSGAVPAAG